MRRAPPPLPRALAALLLLVPAAFAGGGARLDPAGLATALAGRYDNLAQAALEQQAGLTTAHEALSLAIIPVTAPLVADVVLFVQESAADDPRRVFSQRIWVLGEDARHRVAVGVYRFVEPERWRAAEASPELFRALLIRDLQPLEGCTLRWSRTPHGLRGVNDPAQCRAAGAAGATQYVEQVFDLDGTALAFSERRLDARGATVRGRDSGSPYLFRRRPAP